jgi:Eco57I restriction-modification methylase/MmeI, target recognition domain
MSPRQRRSTAASHHVEWLQLVDISGPFLSLSVLTEAFPQGLDGVDPEVAERLRTAYSEWTANRELRHPDIALHTAFLRFVLTEILEYPNEFIADTQELGERFLAPLPEHGITLRPDLAVRRPGELPRLLLAIYPAGVSLQKPYDERGFHASPAERMRLLLRQTGVRSGLVTSGGEWLLVHVPADRTATFTTWYTNLLVEERITLRALRSLLGARRLFGVGDPETLDGLFERSRDDEREVTDQLGLQTRHAVELLVSAFDRADRDTNGKLLEHVPEYRLYEAALAIVMRIIFLLAAEARGLFPDDGPWADSYAITPLRAQLEELADRGTLEALDRRYDAWPRLLATFRAVHDGVEHSRVRMPGYGGGLFDPDRYAFLEGADTAIPRVSNRAVLHILDALQTLEVDVPGGRERRPLSFRALGVEQIGHVYEGLLDHTAIRADAPALGLTGTAKKEPEIPLAELEERAGTADDALLDLLVEQTGRSRSALKKSLVAAADPIRVAHLREASDHDDQLVERVLPFLGLLRDDVFGLPMVFRMGAIYVTESPGRRATGTHYTPPSLTEPIVQYALEPVVYQGPAEGRPREEWNLKRPSELLELKIADIAMGSAAFLVAACRYLAARLVESWERFADETPADAGGDLEERELTARRLVAERCLYGVDVNPLAVEIAKVSMWLTTLRRDRPFTFLDHALRCGDSLLGLTSLEQLEALTCRPEEADSILLEPVREAIRTTVDEVRTTRELIEATDAIDLREAGAKATAFLGAERKLNALIVIADLVVGAALEEAAGNGRARTIVEAAADEIREALAASDDDRRDALLAQIETRAKDALTAGRAPSAPDPPKPFHWALECPEVFKPERGGFDAIVGNPPFLGGKKISVLFGTAYREHLAAHLSEVRRPNIDLVAFFVSRAASLVGSEGSIGLIATNTISQGNTREASLDVLTGDAWVIHRADSSRPWPGEAGLEIAQLWLTRHGWSGSHLLDGEHVAAITPSLTPRSRATGNPHRLAANFGECWVGSMINGIGFVLGADEAAYLLERDPRNQEVVRPYLSGDDLVTSPSLAPSRYVIDFKDWDYERASDHAECLEIVRERVKPHRDGLNPSKVRVITNWWKFEHTAQSLYEATRLIDRMIAIARVSKYLAPAFVPTTIVVSDKVIGIASNRVEDLGVIASTWHFAWAMAKGTTLETRPVYDPKASFETFPWPESQKTVSQTAQHFLGLRDEVMRGREVGLTRVYNLFHDPAERTIELGDLRLAHAALDRAVAEAYGWADLVLDHDFRETPLGLRYTISEAVKTEVLDRLLELNHARYAEEVAQGLHAKGAKKRGARKSHEPAEQLEL